MKKSSAVAVSASLKLLVLTSLSWPWASAVAAPIYWDGVGGTATDDWGLFANWSADPDAAIGATAIPGTGDVATFSTTTVTAAQTIKLIGARSVAGLDFVQSTPTTLNGGTAARVLTLGLSGINKNNTGLATIGSATATENVSLSLTGSQIWSNVDASTAGTASLSILNGVSTAVAGVHTLTLEAMVLAR
jgi:hypothetical protein